MSKTNIILYWSLPVLPPLGTVTHTERDMVEHGGCMIRVCWFVWTQIHNSSLFTVSLAAIITPDICTRVHVVLYTTTHVRTYINSGCAL